MSVFIKTRGVPSLKISVGIITVSDRFVTNFGLNDLIYLLLLFVLLLPWAPAMT
jgi:hypothetical protein